MGVRKYMKLVDIGPEKPSECFYACCPFVKPRWYTCADCIKYETCTQKEEQAPIGTKFKELVANVFDCFVLRKEDINDRD